MTGVPDQSLKKKLDSRLDYYESLESMEGMTLAAPDHPPGGVLERIPRIRMLRAIYPGAIAAGTVGLAATWLSQHYNAPVMLFALLLGIAFHFLHEEGRCIAGIEYCARTVLRVGVALLGARITATQIAGLGIAPILTVLVGVTTTTLLGAWLSRRLGLGEYFGILSGGAVAICGASAALAISTALPAHPEKERDTVLTVVAVTALSTIAMILYPLLIASFHLDNTKAGIFLGGTIHDVAQVVGAGYMISQVTGDIATYVKLLRVATLIPVVLCVSVLLTHRVRATGGRGGKAPPFPLFLAGFAALVAVNSVMPLPPALVSGATTISSWCLVTAISALGMKTSFGDLIEVGLKPVGLMVVETIWLAALVLLAVMFMT
jgi:uncharacterized integral membrane protein (TIGR00698 family)